VKHKIRTNSKFSCFFKKYFGLEILNQNKPWVPHVICGSCRATLEAWLRGEKRKMTCGIPRLWREPQNHVNDCFFCLLDLSHFKKTKNRFHIQFLLFELLFYILWNCHHQQTSFRRLKRVLLIMIFLVF
jgi:LSD1 subclass zinc finger protein